MLRNVIPGDASSIARIYNEYVLHSVATFETEEITVSQMRDRIAQISPRYPYLVYETDARKIAGYAYAHTWRERAAYRYTWETTVYVAPQFTRQGIGTQLLAALVEECRRRECYALVACITSGNTASCDLHRKAGFRQVSQFEKVGVKFSLRLDVTDWELVLRP